MTVSPKFPSRDEYTRWHNDKPYTDAHIALALLRKDSPTHEPNHLDRCAGKEFGWEITTPWYTHGDSGGDQSGYDYHQIDPVLAEELVKEGWLENRKILRPGYTEERPDEFVISEAGKEKLSAYLAEMRTKATSMLIPGIHTDLTGEARYRGYDRDDWGWGPLAIIFALPEGRGHCRVYPEEGRIAMPEPDESETEAA